MPIHPTAIVDPGRASRRAPTSGRTRSSAAEVEIGARTRLMANAYIEGPTWIGEDNIFFPFSFHRRGLAGPQIQRRARRNAYRNRNRIREFVTIHRGTAGGGLVTRIGSDNLIMTYAHVAHDCQIGDHVILGNSVGLAGHVVIEDWVDVAPFSGVHQFCRIGKHAFIGPYSVIKQDIMPYSLTSYKPEVSVFGANSVGLERRGFSKQTDRVAADRAAPADAVESQYLAGHRADPRGSAAVRRGGRTARIHRASERGVVK
jgi:UDP-N-acetylglucosamine acyltransferase